MIKRWFIPLFIIAVFIFIAALFLTPSFTRACTQKLYICLNEGMSLSFWGRLWAHLGCVYHNVICVLGGLFV